MKEIELKCEEGSRFLDGPWLCIPMPDHDNHVIFEPEQTRHELDRWCWCAPHVEERDHITGERYKSNGAVVVHPNARERFERAEAETA